MKGGTKTITVTKKPAGKPKQKPAAHPGSQGANGGTMVVRAPAATGYSAQSKFKVERSTKFKDGVCISGEDHLEFVTIATSSGTGSVLNEIYINPSELGGTRLEKWAQMYEKYIFTDLIFEYLPACGSDSKGSIILAYDRDISDPTPAPNEQGLRQFTAFDGSKDGNVWERIVINAKIQAPDSGYYTNPVVNGDDRLSYQGQFYVAVVVPSTADFTCGRLRMKYRVELFVPQLEQGVMTSELAGTVVNNTLGPNVYDFFKLLLDSLVFNEGVPQWLPKLDSAGKAFIRLAQGVYRMTQVLNGVTSTAAASTLDAFVPPSLVVIEDVTPTAPQPWVEVLAHADFPATTGQKVGALTQESLIGVPRGGADVYVDVGIQSGLTNPGSNQLIYDHLLERLSGYTANGNGFFLARWEGVAECRDPLSVADRASERALKKAKARVRAEHYAAVIKLMVQLRQSRMPQGGPMSPMVTACL